MTHIRMQAWLIGEAVMVRFDHNRCTCALSASLPLSDQQAAFRSCEVRTCLPGRQRLYCKAKLFHAG